MSAAEDARPPVPKTLQRFIWDIQSIVELAESEREILIIGRDIAARVVESDDWLPEIYATPDPARLQQFQLYQDGMERFAIVATILAPGQAWPILLDPVWEIAGVLRGSATRERFTVTEDGRVESKGAPSPLAPRAVETRAAKVSRHGGGDAIRLANALPDAVSIVVHAYGGEIGKLPRRAFDGSGDLVTGYANGDAAAPYDIWSIQHEIKD